MLNGGISSQAEMLSMLKHAHELHQTTLGKNGECICYEMFYIGSVHGDSQPRIQASRQPLIAPNINKSINHPNSYYIMLLWHKQNEMLYSPLDY